MVFKDENNNDVTYFESLINEIHSISFKERKEIMHMYKNADDYNKIIAIIMVRDYLNRNKLPKDGKGRTLRFRSYM